MYRRISKGLGRRGRRASPINNRGIVRDSLTARSHRGDLQERGVLEGIRRQDENKRWQGSYPSVRVRNKKR